jgi:hypothetical protein
MDAWNNTFTLSPVYTPCVLRDCFRILIKLRTYQKKKKTLLHFLMNKYVIDLLKKMNDYVIDVAGSHMRIVNDISNEIID